MAALMMEPQVQWVAAAPLWNETMDTPVQMQRPALLGFASDTFMDDLNALLQAEPETLMGLRAKRESFRARPVGEDANWTPALPPLLKLYQPAHGRFYLVTASLVCRLVGLPDRYVEAANESVGFVLRRVLNDGSEQAWVNHPVNGKNWMTVTTAKQLAAFEDVQPMFPVGYTQDEQRRRLFAGLVPTSSGDTYPSSETTTPLPQRKINPATGLPFDPPQYIDPRLEEAETRVLGVLEQNFFPPLVVPAPNPDAARLLAQGQQAASRFLLLDLAEILVTYLPTLWGQIEAGTPPAVTAPGFALYALLNEARVGSASSSVTWREALRTIWAARAALMRGEDIALTFNLKDATRSGVPFNVASLRSAMVLALGSYTPPAQNTPPPPPASTTPTDVMRLLPKYPLDARYIVRCVYQRPNCKPLIADVVSEPTELFTIASFFDPDAPTRPIRIPMPIDTTIAGLRQFPKNVGVLISDKLREQMSSVTDLKKALDGNLASGESFDLGVICSFSIPIISICALIVLMIFIYLLNIVFWWVPFLRICLPIPIKAKS